jgi:hypothetical protein
MEGMELKGIADPRNACWRSEAKVTGPGIGIVKPSVMAY